MDRFPATPEALGLTVAPASAADAVRRAAATLSCGAGGERHPARKMAPRARQVFEAVKARYANAGANMVEVIETARVIHHISREFASMSTEHLTELKE